ncbi:nuclease-related domain-containing protein [Psychrobacillus psychrodurans]|uniref:nuclease-related domain-containing protein n=1 Tax=Psychrobacillus psychrodurans TaxID=126157 RepID=UPI0008E7DD82|nr:nuclease-related domain-containing protein [Psychrobacillus psychrodurans]MCZ8539180.1 NERD domain-containing protein [Psychrobacillus psychrodurans]SFM33333.1 Nuclease-related domain-containing protein [Psychrobacillus psychrodurans]
MNGHFALLNRLRDGSGMADFIREEIRKQKAGVRGEDRLVARLKELRLQGEFRVFSDVCLVLDDWKVQIDCLVVTDRCCIVLESKNISGHLYFNEELDEFYKEENGVESPISNPYFQLMRHIRFMKEFLRKTHTLMKVTGAVIMTAKSHRIMQKPTHYPIYKLESMIERVTQIYNSSGGTSFSGKDIELVEKLLLEKRSDYEHPPLCEHYRIPPSEILLGVECPSCSELGMRRTGKTWTCVYCNKRDRNAHKKTVDDFFLLINNKITNRDFRKFCMVESIYAASRMLGNMDLHMHKAGGKTYYTKK